MPVDPSWLPSTVAQSTAALVGIVGGLLVARFVGLDAEQRAAAARLTEAREREVAAGAEREGLAAEIRQLDVDDVFVEQAVIDVMIERQGRVGAAEVLAVPEVRTDLDEPALAPYVAEVATAVWETVQLCVNRLPEAGERLPDWDHVRDAFGLPRDRWDFQRELAFDRFVEVRREEAEAAREAEHAARSRADAPFPERSSTTDFLAEMNASVTAQHLDVIKALPHTRAIAAQRARLSQRLADAEAQLRAAGLEREQAERAARQVQTPPGLLWAVGVLTALTVVGLGWPVLALYLEPAYNPSARRLGVLVAFLGGLVLLLGYLWAYAWRLSRQRKPNADGPSDAAPPPVGTRKPATDDG